MERRKKAVVVSALIVVVIAVFAASYYILQLENASETSSSAPYACHFAYDSSKYSECRVFAQTGMEIIHEDSQGRVLEDLLLQGAPVGSCALWTTNGTIIVTFPNGTSVNCVLLHSPHGPCFEGIA